MPRRYPLPNMPPDVLALPDLSRFDTSSLFVCATGGAACPPELARTIQGRFGCALYQGFGMCAMPFVLVALFSVMNPALTSLLFTTPLGWVIWLIVIVMDVLGMWAIMKVVKVDV